MTLIFDLIFSNSMRQPPVFLLSLPSRPLEDTSPVKSLYIHIGYRSATANEKQQISKHQASRPRSKIIVEPKMAEKQQIMDAGQHQVSSKTVAFASLAGLALGGPLLGMMGFSFLASLTLLLVTSPLLIIFSPLLFGAGCIFAFAMAGFALAVAIAFAGLSSIRWIYKSSRGRRSALGFDSDVSGKLIESGETVKEHGKDWAGYLQQKAQNPQENLVNRG